MRPRGDQATTPNWKAFEYEKLLCDTAEAYDQQIKDTVEAKYPGLLNGLRDEAGNLPISLTGKEALLAYVEQKVKDNSLTNKCLQDLTKRRC